MAYTDHTPQLTANNRIYLYQLLARELGCGKQAFLPAVEEALAADRMTADDLGFASTRALLEALEEFVKLTVFKGGRIYATVIAQPAWDEALAALESGKAKGAGASVKPWKRKKADKALKPVRPKRVKRTEPEPDPEPMTKPEPEPGAKAAEAMQQAGEVASPVAKLDAAPSSATGDVTARHGEDGDHAPSTSTTPDLSSADTAVEERDAAVPTSGAADEAGQDIGVSGGAQAEIETVPAISLTVTYDPYSGIDRETKLVSHPAPAPKKAVREPKRMENGEAPRTPEPSPGRAARTASAPAPKTTMPAAGAASAPVDAPTAPAGSTLVSAAPAPASVAHDAPAATADSASAAAPAPASVAHDAPAAPEILSTYPGDFSTEVYLASVRIADLCELLPYGTDAFALLAEDYARARTLGLIEGTRARATFPLRIQHADSVSPIQITLKKRSGSGLRWELSSIA